jgi:hypothetical protein
MDQSSHVINARVDYYLSGDQFWTNVSFSSLDEVQELIDALVALKQSRGSERAHFHLQSPNLSPHSRPSEGEIMFELLPQSKLWTNEDREYWTLEADKLLAVTGGP